MSTHDYPLIFLLSLVAFVTVIGRSQTGQESNNYRGKPKVQSATRYMVELYERYKNDQRSFFKNSSTTVRSIIPMNGKLEGGEMLVYNLTSVPRTELIVKAELHAYIRRKKSKTHIYFLNLWDLMLMPSPALEEHRIGKEVGWSVYNVTQSVLKCRTGKGENQNLLGISLQSSSDRRKIRPLPIRRLVGSNPQPFLVLFSEDKSNNRSAVNTFQSLLEDIVDKYVGNSRRKRSVHDNKLPEHPHYHMNVPPLIPSSGNYRKGSRVLQKGNSRGGKRQKGRKYKKKRKHRKLPFLRGNWSTPHENDANIIDEEELGIGLCQKKELWVDFGDLGWDDWIIAPPGYMINYCSGHCPFPPLDSLQPSNHATLRGIFHYLNLYPNVPSACCVPDVMSSMSLLFLSEDDKIVLKNYPNMIVESCACR